MWRIDKRRHRPRRCRQQPVNSEQSRVERKSGQSADMRIACVSDSSTRAFRTRANRLRTPPDVVRVYRMHLTLRTQSEHWQFDAYSSRTERTSGKIASVHTALVYTVHTQNITWWQQRRTNYNHLKQSRNRYFGVRRNLIIERAKFNRRIPQGECVDVFIQDVYHLVEHCDYGDLREQLLRDRIVVGMIDDAL